MTRYSANQTNRKRLIQTVSAIALAGLLPAVSMAKPTETRLSGVENCQFLGKVEGSSGYGRKFDWLRPAKSSALHRAETLGASHVVWERMVPVGVYNGHAVARVFSCG